MKVMAPKNKVESTIHAQGTEISILSSANEEDFISLTDLARYRNSTAPKDVVKNWMRIRSTIEFLGGWEVLNILKGSNSTPLKTDHFLQTGKMVSIGG